MHNKKKKEELLQDGFFPGINIATKYKKYEEKH